MQDSIYARAKRRELPDILSLREVAQLSRACLSDPNGRIDNNDSLLTGLYRLIAAGLMTPERSEKKEVPAWSPLLAVVPRRGPVRLVEPRYRTETSHYLSAATLWPHLAELGEIGPLLADWVNVGKPPISQSVAPRSNTVKPSKAEIWNRQHMPLVRLLAGITALGTENSPNDYETLNLTENNELPFTRQMFLEAVEQYDPGAKIPVTDAKSQKKWLDELYPHIKFAESQIKDRAHTQQLLNNAYEIGCRLGSGPVEETKQRLKAVA